MANSNTIVKGQELMLFQNGESIAFATSHTLTVTGNTTDISTKDHGFFAASSLTSITWEISSENLANGAIKGGMSEKKIFRNPITNAEEVGKKLLSVLKDGDVLLVKASRGIAAENVLNYVKAQLA